MFTMRGWHVFPAHSIRDDGSCTCGRADCPSPGKHPATAHGAKDATDDVDQIERWWRARPNANVAVATGAASGCFVVDIDDDHGGEASLREIEAAHSTLPATLQSRTGRGRHIWFRYPGEHVPNRTGLLPGIDVRGETPSDGARPGKRGLVIAPPSRHVSGARYHWLNTEPLADAPAWLLDLIRGTGAEPKPNASVERSADLGPANNKKTEAAPVADPHRPLTPLAARAALKAEAELVRRAQPGSRNGTLNRAAFKIGQLIAAELLTRDEAETALSDAARECGLKEVEVAATLHSGFGAGEAHPREAADAEPVRAGDGVALTWSELLAHPDPEWLIDGVLMAGGLAVLYGPPKCGKSFVALDMACSIATDLAWQGNDTKGGRVVYISAEGTPKRRALAWAKANGADADKLLVWTQRVNLRNDKERRQFVDAISADGWAAPVLVVVDTLSQNFGGRNENDGDAMSEFIDALAKLRESLGGATVLVLHHTGKDQSRGARGHSALPAAADTMIEAESEWLGPSESDSGAVDYVAHMKLTCQYQRDDEPFPPLEFGLRRVDLGYEDAKGRRVRSLVVEPFDPGIHNFKFPTKKKGTRDDDARRNKPKDGKENKRKDNAAHALDVLRDAGAEGLTFNDWFRQTKTQVGKLGKVTFKKLVNELADGSSVVRNGDRYTMHHVQQA